MRLLEQQEHHIVTNSSVTMCIQIGEDRVEHIRQFRVLDVTGEAGLEIEPLAVAVASFDCAVAVEQNPGTGRDRHVLGDTVRAETQRQRRTGVYRLDAVAIGE